MAQQCELADGLFRLAATCNVYAVKCPDGVVLIDAGTDASFAGAVEALKAAGLAQPEYVLITHYHFDHTEAAKRWRDLGAQIAASHLEAGRIEDGSASRIACPVDILLRPDQELRLLGATFQVLAAPGHTPGSLAFETLIGDERWLFTGDLVMLNRCPGWLGQFDLRDTIATLRKLARRPANSIATGHSHVRGDGTGLMVDSLCAAFDGTWYRHLLAHKDQLPGGTLPEEVLRMAQAR